MKTRVNVSVRDKHKNTKWSRAKRMKHPPSKYQTK